MKRHLILPFCLLLAAAALTFVLHGRPIGTIRGAEMEQIIIDGVTYVQNPFLDFTYADKGRFLGRAVNDNTTFRLYAVKGDPDGQYLYRLWSWEGAFYERRN